MKVLPIALLIAVFAIAELEATPPRWVQKIIESKSKHPFSVDTKTTKQPLVILSTVDVQQDPPKEKNTEPTPYPYWKWKYGFGKKGSFGNKGYLMNGYPMKGYPKKGDPMKGYPKKGYPMKGYPKKGYPLNYNGDYRDEESFEYPYQFQQEFYAKKGNFGKHKGKSSYKNH